VAELWQATYRSELYVQVAQLLAENSRLKELNSSHREQLEQASEELQKAKSEAQQVRAALLQSQEDIAHLLRIADEKQASLSQAEAEKQKISKQHDQACAFADSVQDEIKRLEGLLDELRKRQAMTSVVVESLTNERDERKQEVDTAKSRIVDLELEVAGFKKLCSAQKQMLQESSNELDSLQRRLKGENGQAMPPKRQDELVHESLQPLVRAAQHQATRSSNQKPFVSNNAEVQRILQASNPTPSAQPGLETEKPASRTGSVWAQASKGISFHLDLKEVANRNQHTDIGADGKATSTSIHTQPSAQVVLIKYLSLH
jgi:chromosome segregation ATPase